MVHAFSARPRRLVATRTIAALTERARAPARGLHRDVGRRRPANAHMTEANPTAGGMTHRQILEAMSGLMLGMFVAILSSTVVSTSLPRIVSRPRRQPVVLHLGRHLDPARADGEHPDLGQARRPVRPQAARADRPVIFVFGSMLAGLSQSMGWLIACRVLQGIGVGGLTALVQVILSDLVSPRERGRYAGYLGAVFGVGTVAGPLLGGVITDSAGWRWCFYVGVPFALAAFVVLQRTLRLPRRRREVRDRLPRRHADRRRRLEPADLGLARRPAVRLDVLADRRAGRPRRRADRRRRRRRAPRRASRSSRCSLFGDRTVVLAVIASDRGRHRDVRHHRLPQPVHADRARQVADRVRPADDPDGGRPVRRVDDRSAASSAAPATTSAG